MQNKAVILDRDGVINEVNLINSLPHPPASIADLIIIAGVEEAIMKLKQNGFLIFCLTNQPDVARGQTPRHKVDEINEKITAMIGIDELYTCFHDDDDKCICRKPKPGGIHYFIDKFNLNLRQTYMVGDRWKDIDAGNAAGCKTIYIESDYAEPEPQSFDFSCKSLFAATEYILRGN